MLTKTTRLIQKHHRDRKKALKKSWVDDLNFAVKNKKAAEAHKLSRKIAGQFQGPKKGSTMLYHYADRRKQSGRLF